MYRKIFVFFDKLEDKVRGICLAILLYAFIGGIGSAVLAWNMAFSRQYSLSQQQLGINLGREHYSSSDWGFRLCFCWKQTYYDWLAWRKENNRKNKRGIGCGGVSNQEYAKRCKQNWK